MFRSLGSVAASLVIAATPAAAQSLPCAPREQVLQFVIDQRGEERLATGVANRGATLDLFAASSGTWSLVLHLPDGRSCLLANGTGFDATHGLQPARGNPA
ncbi:hypothetical protein [Pararhodobacter sp.]|uniref:hypothetical protein n=1 Tax=Pararhodobacter sp. TaxID=2127056 RepID=UPI002AFF8F02|nr:hypothetical protein [Pararhodobacter sp.]